MRLRGAEILVAAISLANAQTTQTPKALTATSTTVAGVLLGPAGSPLSGAQIRLESRPTSTFRAIVTADALGAFTFSGVPSGSYAVCPVPPNDTSVSPCDWDSEPRATVGLLPVTLAAIHLLPAADLYVRVNDPHGTRAATEGHVPGAALFLAVRSSNGNLLPIPLTARDAAGYDHHLRVPTGVNLTLISRGGAYSLVNSALAPISKTTGLLTTVTVAAGATQHVETITIN